MSPEASEKVRVLENEGAGDWRETWVDADSAAAAEAQAGSERFRMPEVPVHVMNPSGVLVALLPERFETHLAILKLAKKGSDGWRMPEKGETSAPLKLGSDPVETLAVVHPESKRVQKVPVDSPTATFARRSMHGYRLASEREQRRADECGHTYRVDLDAKER